MSWIIRVEGINGKSGYLRLFRDDVTGLTAPQIVGRERATALSGLEPEVQRWCAAAQGLLSLRHPTARLTPERA